MAGIDKTYISGKDYKIYREWWIDNYDKMVKELGEVIWLYTFSFYNIDDYNFEVTPEFLKTNTDDLKYFDNLVELCIWNTSEYVDKWLIKNCDITSFRERMLEVYPRNWKGFKGQEAWIPKPKSKQKYKR